MTRRTPATHNHAQLFAEAPRPVIHDTGATSKPCSCEPQSKPGRLVRLVRLNPCTWFWVDHFSTRFVSSVLSRLPDSTHELALAFLHRGARSSWTERCFAFSCDPERRWTHRALPLCGTFKPLHTLGAMCNLSPSCQSFFRCSLRQTKNTSSIPGLRTFAALQSWFYTVGTVLALNRSAKDGGISAPAPSNSDVRDGSLKTNSGS